MSKVLPSINFINYTTFLFPITTSLSKFKFHSKEFEISKLHPFLPLFYRKFSVTMSNVQIGAYILIYSFFC